MQSHNQARANAARRRQAETGESYAAALAAIRQDRLNEADHATEAGNPPVDRGPDYFHDKPVPEVLTELVRYHSHRIAKHLYFAMDEGRWRSDFAEWQAMTLYKLTDAAAHLNLLIGTITAYLRDEGVGRYFLRRYLQVNQDHQVEAYLTPRVEEHLAGLTGQPAPEHSIIWHSVGSDIASQSGWNHPEQHEALEAALHALYGNYPDDDEAFNHLPPALRERVLALIPLMKDQEHSGAAD
ncbi:hypothetical protein [Streptomyces lavenduligriseus]|uniref:Uncharacterized protein n=1 Tax=Streptomyces lavenduligriseus TaxID=67315 RepID=A0ABT0P333_9ACTN|nr:hypothetical protein [Streptomyces lavenduligriseus]MCL3998144.1 hypothetical protein [Streptomyces lavenduligriseus]